MLWHSWHVPRFSFILWLAIRGRLRTMDRYHNSIDSPLTCYLCNEQNESHDHLFFSCKYSNHIWREVSHRAAIHWQGPTWKLAWEDFVSNSRGCRKSKLKLWGLVFSAAIYHLWRERNLRRHNNHFSCPNKTLADTINSIRERLSNLHDGAGVLEEDMRRWEVH